MKTTSFYFTMTFGFLLFSSSCGKSAEKKKVTANVSTHSFVSDTIPDFELLARPLEGDSKETITYELKVLNHTSEFKKVLFYYCDINYGIHSTGGMISPQRFECNANVPYFKYFPAHGELKYHVKMDRSTVRDPKFYWNLVVVKQEGFEDSFTVLDTIKVETY